MTVSKQRATRQLDADLLMTLDAALKLLPGIMPRKARTLLSGTAGELAANELHGREPKRALIGETVVSADDLREVFVDDAVWGTPHVTPKGAQLLLDLYRSGAFQMKRKSDRPGEASELAAYAAKGAELERAQTERDAKKAERSRLVENPDEIAEDQFEFSLLDAVFWRHVGQGGGTMVIGGIEVSKSVTPYRSNSGKSRDFEVTISWTGSDGERRSVTKESRYAGSRRNDSARNWGLGRE